MPRKKDAAMTFSLEKIKETPYEHLQSYTGLVRQFLVQYFSEHGGHAGSNLGIVELLVSILKEFDYEEDYILFDTGHQSYLMKLFTGRPNHFSTIRKANGLSGFMDKNENPRDLYLSGHGGAGFSAAVGLSHAFDHEADGRVKNIVCVIGDAALSEGVALEALNNISPTPRGARLIIVLNDNGYSIEQNVGNLASIFKDESRTRQFFHLFGLDYYYCGNGHDMCELRDAWTELKQGKGNCVLHARTKKGYGLTVAEADAERKMHYTEPFHAHTGERKSSYPGLVRYVDINSIMLREICGVRNDLVVITPAMRGGNGLDDFRAHFPGNFIDVGMCEQHALSGSNGLSIGGKLPIIALHSAFLPRAFDQLLQDICLQNIHVVLLIGRSGFAGPDGPTHHGVFDMSYLRCLPNLKILSPKSGEEYGSAISHAVYSSRGPIAILTPHSYTTFSREKATGIPIDKSLDYVHIGYELLLITTGPLFDNAKQLYEISQQEGYSCGLLHIRWIKPLAAEELKRIMAAYSQVIVMEENTTIGGIGSEIAKLSAENKSLPPVHIVGLADVFMPHGDIASLRKWAGLDPEAIFARLGLQRESKAGRIGRH